MKSRILLLFILTLLISSCTKEVTSENNNSSIGSKAPSFIPNTTANPGCTIESETLEGDLVNYSQFVYDPGSGMYYVNAITNTSEVIITFNSNSTDISGVYNSVNSSSPSEGDCKIEFYDYNSAGDNYFVSESSKSVFVSSNDAGGYQLEFCDILMTGDLGGEEYLEANFEIYE